MNTKNIALITFLILCFVLIVSGCEGGGGCATNRGSEDKVKAPMDSDATEEVLKEEASNVMKDSSEESESKIELIYDPLVGKDSTFKIELSSSVIGNIDKMYSSNKEIIRYPVFELHKYEDLTRVRNFVELIAGDEIKEEAGRGYYEWEFGKNLVVYGHYLFLDFQEPMSIPNTQIDMGDKVSIENALENLHLELLGSEEKYRVESIIEIDQEYHVYYNRFLNGLPLYFMYNAPLIFTKEGKLIRGTLPLFNLKETGKVNLLSGEEFSQNVVQKEFPKSIVFETEVPDYESSLRGRPLLRHSEGDRIKTDGDHGSINFEEVELVYFCVQGETLILPMFILRGRGVVNPERHPAYEYGVEIEFEALTNAMALEHIKDYKAVTLPR